MGLTAGSGGETVMTGIVVDAAAVEGEVDAIGAGAGRGVGRRREEDTDGVRVRGRDRDPGRVRVRVRDHRRVGGTVGAVETTRATADANVGGGLVRGLARGLARGRRDAAEADTLDQIDGKFLRLRTIESRRVS